MGGGQADDGDVFLCPESSRTPPRPNIFARDDTAPGGLVSWFRRARLQAAARTVSARARASNSRPITCKL